MKVFFDWWPFWITWLGKYHPGTLVANSRLASHTIKLLKSNFLNLKQVHRADWKYAVFQLRFCKIYQNLLGDYDYQPSLKIIKYSYLFWVGIIQGFSVLFLWVLPLPPLLPFNQIPSRQAFCTLAQMLTISRALKAICVWREPGVGRWIYGHFWVPFTGWQTCCLIRDLLTFSGRADTRWETWDPRVHNTISIQYMGGWAGVDMTLNNPRIPTTPPPS